MNKPCEGFEFGIMPLKKILTVTAAALLIVIISVIAAPGGGDGTPNEIGVPDEIGAPDEAGGHRVFGESAVSPTEAPTTGPTEPEPSPAEEIIPDGSAETSPDGADMEGLEELKAELENYISGLDGDWAVYVKNLETNEYMEIDSHQMVAASLIKLFIMAAFYDKADNGELEFDTAAADYMSDMITISHNEASNELVRMLGGGDHPAGMEVVNRYTAENGYPDTRQERDMKDYRQVPVEGENYTSVKDCGLLLERIYRSECVSAEYDGQMLDMLKRQTRTKKIPAGVPAGVETANKTGELSSVENDVAIIFSPACDYILCVMSNNLQNTSAARSGITGISAMVYEYFNPEG